MYAMHIDGILNLLGPTTMAAACYTNNTTETAFVLAERSKSLISCILVASKCIHLTNCDFSIRCTNLYIKTPKYTTRCLKIPPQKSTQSSQKAKQLTLNDTKVQLCAIIGKCSAQREQGLEQILNLIVKFVKIAKRYMVNREKN